MVVCLLNTRMLRGQRRLDVDRVSDAAARVKPANEEEAD